MIGGGASYDLRRIKSVDFVHHTVILNQELPVLFVGTVPIEFPAFLHGEIMEIS